MTDPDSDLMVRFRDGDEAAFGELVQRHQRALINFFYRLTWDRFTAEDYSQEVFTRVLKAAGRYRPEAKFRTWLFRIAKNYWIDRYRERATQPRTVSLATPIGEDGGRRMTLEDVMEGSTPVPERQVGSREIGDAVKDAVSRLPEEQRLVFVLSENQGLKYAEIAEVLEIPVGTVKSRMHTAVRRLRELLKDFHDA